MYAIRSYYARIAGYLGNFATVFSDIQGLDVEVGKDASNHWYVVVSRNNFV